MNVDKRGVIIAMALGDGHVQVRTQYNGASAYESRSLRVAHGPNQRAYCEWKAKRLGWALGGRQINVTKVKSGPGGKYDAYHFMVSHPYFAQVRRLLYPNGKKLITRAMLDMLTPEGLAIWYMDDGRARRHTNTKGFVSSVSTNIATMCSEAEVHVIIDWFKDRYGIDFKVRRKKTCSPGHQFFIECGTEASNKFASIIAPHIDESMMYKLAHVALLKSQECQTPISVCECGDDIYQKRYGGLCAACYGRERRKITAAKGDEIVRPNGNNEPLEAQDKELAR